IAALIMWRFLPETHRKENGGLVPPSSLVPADLVPPPGLVPTRGTTTFHETERPEKCSGTPRGYQAPQANGNFLRETLRDMLLHLHNRRLVGAFIIGFTLFFG